MSEPKSKIEQTRLKLPKKKEFMKFYKQNQRQLSLYQSQLNDEDVKAILEVGLCINILWLSINNLTEVAAEYLSKSKLQLQEIYIGWNRLGNEGSRYLSMAPWPKLKKIWIVHNYIGPLGAKYLSQADWKQLEQINIGHNLIEDAGCKYLMKANWKNLKKLWLQQYQRGRTQYADKSQLEEPDQLQFMYKCFQKGSNLLHNQGCFILLKVDWQNIKSLNLLRNKVEPYETEAIKQMFASKVQTDLQIDL